MANNRLYLYDPVSNTKILLAKKKVKLIDKIRALELAGKARGYYGEIDPSKVVPQIQVVFVNAAQPGSAPGRIDEAAPIEVAFVRRTGAGVPSKAGL